MQRGVVSGDGGSLLGREGFFEDWGDALGFMDVATGTVHLFLVWRGLQVPWAERGVVEYGWWKGTIT